MHSVKLTVTIEDRDDLDMEVRVIAPPAEPAAATAAAPLRKPRAVPSPAASLDDEYTLGGYAGI